MTMESMILNLHRSANRSKLYAWQIAYLKELVKSPKELLIIVPTKHSPTVEPRLLYLLTLTQIASRLKISVNNDKEGNRKV